MKVLFALAVLVVHGQISTTTIHRRENLYIPPTMGNIGGQWRELLEKVLFSAALSVRHGRANAAVQPQIRSCMRRLSEWGLLLRPFPYMPK